MILPVDAKEISASFKHMSDKLISEAMVEIDQRIIVAIKEGKYSTTVNLELYCLSLDQFEVICKRLKQIGYELYNNSPWNSYTSGTITIRWGF